MLRPRHRRFDGASFGVREAHALYLISASGRFPEITPEPALRVNVRLKPRLLRNLPAQPRDVRLGDAGSLAAEPRGDVVGDGRDLRVGVRAAEGGHGGGARCVPVRTRDYDLHDVRAAS